MSDNIEQRKRENLAVHTGPRAWQKYYKRAEPFMDSLWDELIWPLISECDFTTTLDLATGAGRNASKLVSLAKRLYMVDVNEAAITLCRERFENYSGECELMFLCNNGTSLEEIPSDSVTFVYCFDAAVHFEKSIMRDYMLEFSRILTKGGRGFIHHSNYGVVSDTPIQKNPGMRSNMTADLFQEYCQEAGLNCTQQQIIAWGAGEKRINDIDCLSLFSK